MPRQSAANKKNLHNLQEKAQITPHKPLSEATAKDTAKAEITAMDMPDEEILYDLADLFKIFSDTTRVKILLR